MNNKRNADQIDGFDGTTKVEEERKIMLKCLQHSNEFKANSL